jgi:hypothetical protein
MTYFPPILELSPSYPQPLHTHVIITEASTTGVANSPSGSGILRPSNDGSVSVGRGSRLFEHAKLLQAKKEILSRLLPEQCTFRPEVNKRSDGGSESEAGATRIMTGLNESGGIGGGASGGLDASSEAGARLFALARERKARHDGRIAAAPAFSFSPSSTLTKKALALKAADIAESGERDPNIVAAALYARGLAAKEREVGRLAAAMKEFSFEPKITAKAARLKREGKAGDRLYDPSWVKRRNDIKHK